MNWSYFQRKTGGFIEFAGLNALEAKNKGRKGREESGGKNREIARRNRGVDGKQDVMEMVVCQSYPLIHAETDAFDHSKSRA